MAQTWVAYLDNALMVVRNPPSDTGLRVAGLSATLPPPDGFCGVTGSCPVDMARLMKRQTQVARPKKQRQEGQKMTDETCVFSTKMVKRSKNGSANGPVTWRENLKYTEIRVTLLKNATNRRYKSCVNRRFPVRSI